MWKDILTWSILLVACFGSFFVSWLFTLRGLEQGEQHIEAEEMNALTWAVFGHLDLQIDRNDALSVFYFLFQFYVTVLLINLLIAMMGNTFARVWDNSNLEYKSSRVLLKEGYIKLPILPPPINLFCIPSLIICRPNATQHSRRQPDVAENLETMKMRQAVFGRYIETESIDNDTAQIRAPAVEGPISSCPICAKLTNQPLRA